MVLGVGTHHYYLGNFWLGVGYTLTFGFLGIGWIFDLFYMPWLVAEANSGTLRTVRRMDTAVALVAAPTTGLLGIHHHYLGRHFFGIVYTCTLGLCGIGWFIDMFRIHSLVRTANRNLKQIEDPPLYTPGAHFAKSVSLLDAYMLWCPLGLLGLHHFYLRNYWRGVSYLLSFGGLGVGWFLDLFLMSRHVARANREAHTLSPQKSLYDAYR